MIYLDQVNAMTSISYIPTKLNLVDAEGKTLEEPPRKLYTTINSEARTTADPPKCKSSDRTFHARNHGCSSSTSQSACRSEASSTPASRII